MDITEYSFLWIVISAVSICWSDDAIILLLQTNFYARMKCINLSRYSHCTLPHDISWQGLHLFHVRYSFFISLLTIIALNAKHYLGNGRTNSLDIFATVSVVFTANLFKRGFPVWHNKTYSNPFLVGPPSADGPIWESVPFVGGLVSWLISSLPQ